MLVTLVIVTAELGMYDHLSCVNHLHEALHPHLLPPNTRHKGRQTSHKNHHGRYSRLFCRYTACPLLTMPASSLLSALRQF